MSDHLSDSAPPHPGGAACTEEPATGLPSHEPRAGADPSLASFRREYDALVQSVPAGVFRTDADARCVFVSAELSAILGRAPEALLGDAWTSVIHPEDRVCVLAAWKEATDAGSIFELEHRVLHGDGSVRWVACRAVAVPGPEGRAEGFVGTVTDISEHKASAHALGLTQHAIDLLPDSVVVGPPDGSFVLVNEATCRMLGYSREQLLKLKVSDVDPNFPEPAWQAHVERLRERGVLSFQSMGKRQDGSEFPIEVTVRLSRFDGLEYVCAAVRDVSEREQLAAQLRQAQKMEAIGTLASGIAHDFNNALTVITGNLELVSAMLPSEHSALERLEAIRAASERAKSLVQQLMLFGRPRVHERKPVDLASVVHSAVALLRGVMPASIEIAEELADDVPLVKGDPAQIHQVLVNLCMNAWQSHEGRPGRITIGLSHVRSSSASAAAGGRVLLRVSDAGQGMSPDVLARAFDPFFTTKDVGAGTGLGLSVVHGIVQGHGGDIEVESQPGKGTTFRIYLPPIAQDAPTLAPALQSTPEPPTAEPPKRVLFVDDEAAVGVVAKAILTAEGHDVTVHTSAAAALAELAARRHAYDVVLTDLNMPRMTGIELASEISRRFGDLPVLVLSGHVDERVRAAALAAGARDVLPKPWTAGELARAVALLR